MKKILFISLSLILLTGCGNTEDEFKTEKDNLESLATAYYNNHLIGSVTLEEETLSITDFKAMNEIVDTYDLSLISHCADETSISFKVDSKNKTISEFTFNLNCSK